mmetsp:Transcript_1798/g.3748  ORF Transcript_1798/g.3748 Transcript_1798/m.3748 type:complete len:83 (-) Transcript_1798:1542-1790(-)
MTKKSSRCLISLPVFLRPSVRSFCRNMGFKEIPAPYTLLEKKRKEKRRLHTHAVVVFSLLLLLPLAHSFFRFPIDSSLIVRS